MIPIKLLSLAQIKTTRLRSLAFNIAHPHQETGRLKLIRRTPSLTTITSTTICSWFGYRGMLTPSEITCPPISGCGSSTITWCTSPLRPRRWSTTMWRRIIHSSSSRRVSGGRSNQEQREVGVVEAEGAQVPLHRIIKCSCVDPQHHLIWPHPSNRTSLALKA
jgi:uncharacterized protein (UPF0248 family)